MGVGEEAGIGGVFPEFELGFGRAVGVKDFDAVAKSGGEFYGLREAVGGGERRPAGGVQHDRRGGRRHGRGRW